MRVGVRDRSVMPPMPGTEQGVGTHGRFGGGPASAGPNLLLLVPKISGLLRWLRDQL